MADAACNGRSFESTSDGFRPPHNSESIEKVGTPMYAIIETGGKQYKVQNGDVLFIEKLDAAEEASVTFDKVIALHDDAGFYYNIYPIDNTMQRAVSELRKSLNKSR